MFTLPGLTIRRSLLFMLVLSVILLLISFFRLTINGDEGIIAEHSYWFARLKFVKSEMFDGMGLGWEIRQYHFHKLFVYLGALVIEVFGVSLYAMRSISLFFLIVSVIFLYKYSKANSTGQHWEIFCMSTLVFIANYTIIEFGIIFRPETMVMTLGFISFYLIQQGIKNSRFVFYAISALFAGLAAFTHLNGVCFIFAGFLLLLINRKYLAAILFGTIATLTSLLYFIDILSVKELSAFWTQFSNDPNLDNSDLLNPFIKLINEQLRLFWNLNMSLFTILTAFSLIVNFRMLRKNHGNLLLYLLFLVVGLALFSHGKTLKYGLLYFPFMSLIVGLSLPEIVKSSWVRKLSFSLLLFLFLMVNLYSETRSIITSKSTVARNELKSSFMPGKQVNVLGSENFFFNQIENYHLHIRMAFSLYYEKYVKRTPSEQDFYTFAEKGNNYYIIADKLEDTDEFLKIIRFDQLMEGDKVFNYRVIRKVDGFAILEHLK
jgi:hypothetical protein